MKKLINLCVFISIIAYFAEIQTNYLYHSFFLTLERILAIIFTYEIYHEIRFKVNYLKSAEFIVDLISVIPFWVGFFVPKDHINNIEIFRLVRILKLFWHSDSFVLLINVVKTAWPSIKMLGYVLFSLCLVAAAILFKIEPNTFGSIFNALYYCLTTVVTVGFGDYSTKTELGKFITIVLLYGPGLLIAGSLVGVVGAAYNTELERIKNEKKK